MRVALLGSPGIGVPYRLPFRVTGQQAFKNGAAATYAAVVAGHHLDLSLNGIQGTVIVTFAGTENTQALFFAAINAVLNTLGQSFPIIGGTSLGVQSGAAGRVVNNAGQVQLQAPFLGNMSGGSILPTTSADVLVSLGLAAGAFTAAVAAVQAQPGTGGLYAGQISGTGTTGARNQHAIVAAVGMNRAVLLLDRGVAFATSSDNVRLIPAPPLP